jgi:hypothetical protein
MKFFWIILIVIVISAGWFLFAPRYSIKAPIQQVFDQSQNQENTKAQPDNSLKSNNQEEKTSKSANIMVNLQIKSSAFANNKL